MKKTRSAAQRNRREPAAAKPSINFTRSRSIQSSPALLYILFTAADLSFRSCTWLCRALWNLEFSAILYIIYTSIGIPHTCLCIYTPSSYLICRTCAAVCINCVTAAVCVSIYMCVYIRFLVFYMGETFYIPASERGEMFFFIVWSRETYCDSLFWRYIRSR